MTVRYSEKKHYKAIASWFTARGKAAPLPQELPKLGFVVGGRVAGFVVRTDANIAFIDGIISNPRSLPSQRRHDLEILAGVLIDTAISLGYTRVGFTSEHPSIQKIGLKHNFIPTKQTLYVLDEPLDTEYDNESDTFESH